MSDKPTDQINENDEPEFSLNNVDLSDAKSAIDDNESADVLYAPDKEHEAFDSAFEDDKQAPSVPDLFESTAQDLTADTINKQDDVYITAPSAAPNNMTASPDSTETDLTEADDSASPEPSSNNTMFIFAGIAVVLVVLVAWFNLKASNEPSHHGDMNVNMDVVDTQLPTNNEQQSKEKQSEEKQITMLQERIASLQTRLISKDREIAELTHQVSELSRSQTQPRHAKKVPAIKQQSIQKKSATTHALVTPIRQQTTGSWAIIIASVNSRIAAEKALARLKGKGIAADIHPTTVKGKDWFRVRVSGFASRAEAEIQKTYLAQQHGIKGVWIHKAK
ncbi:MAG: SPOR domain-containing protein [Mariprofundus sp.]|nr:SPOR domain-containing protein [Mariprofundus sp.]